jgi:hypothetical protein
MIFSESRYTLFRIVLQKTGSAARQGQISRCALLPGGERLRHAVSGSDCS